MKRILIPIAAVLLAAAMLAGCVTIKFNTPGSGASAPVTPVPTIAPAPSPDPSSTEVTRGSIDGRVYVNESLGLVFTAPDGWEYATDEELAEEAGTGGGVSDGLNTYDMIAEDPTGNSVAVMYQDFAAVPGATYINEKTYLDLLKEELSGSIYYNFEFGDYMDVKICSNTYTVLPLYLTDYGMAQYYYVHRAGNYTICIIATILPGSDIDSIMANFS